MDWRPITDELLLDEILQKSLDASLKGVLIFKHSTRCSISAMALNRLERSWEFSNDQLPVYFLDLIKYRPLSNKIAEFYDVEHASPQVLVIKDKKCIYSESHYNINFSDIRDNL